MKKLPLIVFFTFLILSLLIFFNNSFPPIKFISSQVQAVFAITSNLAKCHLIKRGSGVFAIPEMAIKVVRKVKPATKARQGRNPITGESITIAAKPKREVIKVRPLKTLKEVVML